MNPSPAAIEAACRAHYAVDPTFFDAATLYRKGLDPWASLCELRPTIAMKQRVRMIAAIRAYTAADHANGDA